MFALTTLVESNSLMALLRSTLLLMLAALACLDFFRVSSLRSCSSYKMSSLSSTMKVRAGESTEHVHEVLVVVEDLQPLDRQRVRVIIVVIWEVHLVVLVQHQLLGFDLLVFI